MADASRPRASLPPRCSVVIAGEQPWLAAPVLWLWLRAGTRALGAGLQPDRGAKLRNRFSYCSLEGGSKFSLLPPAWALPWTLCMKPLSNMSNTLVFFLGGCFIAHHRI